MGIKGFSISGGTVTILPDFPTGDPPYQVISPVTNISNGQVVFLNAGSNATNITVVDSENMVFCLVPDGSTPLGYQWFKNGVVVPDKTNFFCSMANLHRADAGEYSIVVSNAVGCVTNTVQLRVLVPQFLDLAIEPTSHNLTVSFRDADGERSSLSDAATFVVETSTDLIDWTVTDLRISTNSDGGLSFQPSKNDPNSNRFFRIVSH